MKLTTKQIQQIIKEELNKVLYEAKGLPKGINVESLVSELLSTFKKKKPSFFSRKKEPTKLESTLTKARIKHLFRYKFRGTESEREIADKWINIFYKDYDQFKEIVDNDPSLSYSLNPLKPEFVPTQKDFSDTSNTPTGAAHFDAYSYDRSRKKSLRGKDLEGYNFSGKYLRHFDLSGTNLNKANLSKADLSGANLRGSDLWSAELFEADLSGANLAGAWLERAMIESANLSGATMKYANLNKADLSGANLSKADLNKANLNKANLNKADLNGANLSDADLRGADLWRADLRGADLRGADLNGANLTEADLSKVNLSGADLRGVDLRGLKLDWLSSIKFDGALYDVTTQLPPWFDPTHRGAKKV